MKINDNGIIRDMTPEEAAMFEEMQPKIPLDERIQMRIRERYSLSDEFKVQRKKDTEPEKFKEYYSFVEQVIAEENAKNY